MGCCFCQWGRPWLHLGLYCLLTSSSSPGSHQAKVLLARQDPFSWWCWELNPRLCVCKTWILSLTYRSQVLLNVCSGKVSTHLPVKQDFSPQDCAVIIIPAIFPWRKTLLLSPSQHTAKLEPNPALLQWGGEGRRVCVITGPEYIPVTHISDPDGCQKAETGLHGGRRAIVADHPSAV